MSSQCLGPSHCLSCVAGRAPVGSAGITAIAAFTGDACMGGTRPESSASTGASCGSSLSSCRCADGACAEGLEASSSLVPGCFSKDLQPFGSLQQLLHVSLDTWFDYLSDFPTGNMKPSHHTRSHASKPWSCAGFAEVQYSNENMISTKTAVRARPVLSRKVAVHKKANVVVGRLRKDSSNSAAAAHPKGKSR